MPILNVNGKQISIPSEWILASTILAPVFAVFVECIGRLQCDHYGLWANRLWKIVYHAGRS